MISDAAVSLSPSQYWYCLPTHVNTWWNNTSEYVGQSFEKYQTEYRFCVAFESQHVREDAINREPHAIIFVKHHIGETGVSWGAGVMRRDA